MSSSDSAVTYTSISSEDVPFWGIRFFGMEQPDSPKAATQSPIQTPPVPQDEDEREPMFIQPHDPEYVPEPMYHEYILLEDENVLPTEEQPLPPVVSPTTESPGYVTESDPEEYEDDESEDGPVDYPMDRGDGGDDDDLGERMARCTAPSTHSSPPHVPSPLQPSYGCLTHIQTLRIASTQALIDAVTAILPSPPLPPLPLPLYIPPPVDRIKEVGYGIRDTWVDPAEVVPEIAPMTLGKVNTRVIELAELHEHDTQDLYALPKDAQDSRNCISQRVTMDSQRVGLLMEDKIAHQETILI
nr:hypothetical protein [Tanacetum cinerariifolium]